MSQLVNLAPIVVADAPRLGRALDQSGVCFVLREGTPESAEKHYCWRAKRLSLLVSYEWGGVLIYLIKAPI